MAKKERKLSEGLTPKEAEIFQNKVRAALPIGEDRDVLISFPKKKIPIQPFAMVFQEALGLLFTKEIDDSAFKILCLFFYKMQWSNFIGMYQETIAEEIRMSISTVKRGIKQLKALNVIISTQDLQDRRINVYMVNPALAWKGKVSERVKAMRKLGMNPAQLLIDFTEHKDDGTQKILS